MTRSEFIAENPVATVLERQGIKINASGMALCPLHADKNPSLSVNQKENTWFCHAGCGGGGVIDLMARLAGVSAVDILKQNNVQKNGDHYPPRPESPAEKPVIDTIYSYLDAFGQEVFQVVRMKPKTFRQRHDQGGVWVWSMTGVERVLYHLPEVLASQKVWIVEGEKDADNLTSLGYIATCNVGGAGKWLDGYTDSLRGKDVVICGDNDKPGKEHVEKVFESISGKVKTAKLIKLPGFAKDASDFIASFPQPESAKRALDDLESSATPFVGGLKLPLYTLAEIEPRYARQVRNTETVCLDLGKWLPGFRGRIRPVVPGELVLLIGGTGIGKTAILQNIAARFSKLWTILFEIELPDELLFERFVAMNLDRAAADVEQGYREGDSAGPENLNRAYPRLLICPETKLTLDSLEQLIVRSELKIGSHPQLVLVDYVQLMQGRGERYEKTSNLAEGLKQVARSTQTIVVASSQISRKNDDSPEISLSDGKDSGSLENSSGLVLGAWRNPKDHTELNIKVLKATKGGSGTHVICNFYGDKMNITERVDPKITGEDVPGRNPHAD